MITKKCAVSGKAFFITDDDKKFYAKMGVPEPILCPEERQRRRLAWRNERTLYRRKCDGTGKMIVSMYPSGVQFPVYDQKYWWSDEFDPLNFGRDFDFNRTFFDQFSELFSNVPRINLMNKDAENAEYCTFSIQNKNSYLLFCCAYCEDCSYATRCFSSRDLYDSMNVDGCELCYELQDCSNCYGCTYLKDSKNCTDCRYGVGLIGCQNCFACSNLFNKQYYIGNKSYSKEDYKKLKKQYEQDPTKLKSLFEEHQKNIIYKSLRGTDNSNCTGDLVSNSKNSYSCFEASHLEDCSYCANVSHDKSIYDQNYDDNSELVYEGIGGEKNYFMRFNDICWFNSYLTYCSLCFHSSNLFGCVGMKRKEYCILNKQYTKDEYEALVPRIIEHMKQTGEWGEFFPIELSPFGYNESMAQDYFPLSQDQARDRGYSWKENSEKTTYEGVKYQVPENINDVQDDILQSILTCEETGKNYRIIKPELEFYRKMDVPVPRICPDERHRQRMVCRNPRQLWDRKCGGCQKDIQTTYSPEGSEKVLCEECYLSAIA